MSDNVEQLQAADEIKQLRFALDLTEGELENEHIEIDRLQTEVGRLRERNNVLETAHRQTHRTLDNAYVEIGRLRASNAELVAALSGMLAEWERLARYGSPLAQAPNMRVTIAAAAIAKAEGKP